MVIKKKKKSKMDRRIKISTLVKSKEDGSVGIIGHSSIDDKIGVFSFMFMRFILYNDLNHIAEYWEIEDDIVEIQNDELKEA
jgi:hypothetical protein